jgi:hypothetical protein
MINTKTSIKKFVIIGERCSGTNYLEESISNNFDIQYTIEHGNKHFFCFNNYNNVYTEDTLFIGIVRNPIYWLNSFSKELHHVPHHNKQSLRNFLFNEFYSIVENDPIESNNNSIMNTTPYRQGDKINKYDLNYVNGKKYSNIFEMRKLKNYYLINCMPKKVKHYILINYENLLYNYNETLLDIKNKFNLKQKHSNHNTFVHIKKYKKSETYNFVQQRVITFSKPLIQLIWNNLNVSQENKLGYFQNDNNRYFKNKNKNKNEDKNEDKV